MVKKNIMTGIGINMASISTDSSFLLGENYCVDINKECKDLGAISDLPVYDRGSTGASKTTSDTLTKKFLVTPEWMGRYNPEESLYITLNALYPTTYYNNFLETYRTRAEVYFPESSSQSNRKGWDKFGNEVTLEYVKTTDPALAIITQQEDLLIGYRDELYNFLFQANQYAYNLEWSLVNAPSGCIMSPSGYFSLSETGPKSVSYAFTVKVYNPDTDETATKDYVLTTAFAAFIPMPLNIPLGLVGPSEITITPHRNFKQVYKAVGGTPPYRFAVNSPLPSQWPYQNNSRSSLHGKDKVGKLQFKAEVSSLYEEDFDKNNVGLFVLGKEIRFEKIPFKANPNETTPPPDPLIELAALPVGLSFNTSYYLIPVMNSSNEWTGYIQFASTYQNAINKIPIMFSGPGKGVPSEGFYYYFPNNPDFAYTGNRAGQTYIKTVNRYVEHLAISLALPPLPQHWGHGNRYDTHVNLEEDDPWKYSYGWHITSAIYDHNKVLLYTYDQTTEEYTWTGGTNIYAWISDDPADVTEPAYLGYGTREYVGQVLPALGFEEYAESSNKTPFDPWRYESLTKTATNYFDITVLDSLNNSFTMRVTVAEPDYDFSPSCGVPYWKSVINYYTCPTPTPMTTEPRTEGKIITYDSDPDSPTYGKTVIKDYDPDYDPDDPLQAYNAQLSETIPALDDVEKFTFEMTHYSPASRFVYYRAYTKYGLTNESTYYPYEKIFMPLDASIHPIRTTSFSNENGSNYRKS
jgi:hypothetical protein